ncbi:phage protease [Brevundimonas faecalis]|uniref:phage protease n=1 Tax=Brevundimonas faecalis TaxID=947378 RepID=UPI00361D88C4
MVIALNVEGGAAPEWVELIPAGVQVKGRDGREWLNDRPADVVAATAGRLPLVLDWEHATEVKASKGEEAPAAAWIEEVEAREGGAIWGRADWTPRGRAQVEAKEYRFLSPGFDFDRATGRIARLVHAGLTNTPNLVLTALNREGADITQKETPLNFMTRLREALGLPADADEDAVLAAVTQARAVNRPVDLAVYAPRAELATALNRATTAEAERDALKAEKTDADIETALNRALDEGRIIPASADQYRTMCRTQGVAEFEKLAATLPVIAGAADSRAKSKIEDKSDTALTDEERAVCRAMGTSEADFLIAKKAEA